MDRELEAVILARVLLTKHDLAQRFNVTLRTIERWHHDGYLPAPKRISGPRWCPRCIADWEKRKSEASRAAAERRQP